MSFIVNDGGCNPSAFAVGERLNNFDVGALFGSLLGAHIYNSTSPYCQGWPDGIRAGNTNGQSLKILTLRLPTLTSEHTSLRVFIDCKSHVSDNSMISLEGAQVLNNQDFFNIGATRGVISQAVTIDASGEYIEIDVTVTNGPTGSFTIYSIDMFYEQLPVGFPSEITYQTGDLETATHHTRSADSIPIRPMWYPQILINRPASSFLGHAAIDSIHGITRRRRSLGCWSAIHNTANLTDYPDGADRHPAVFNMQGMFDPWVVRLNKGARGHAEKYIAHFNFTNLTGDSSISIQLVKPSDPNSPSGRVRAAGIPIRGAATNQWRTVQFEIPEDFYAPSNGSAQINTPMIGIVIAATSNVVLKSFSIWGE